MNLVVQQALARVKAAAQKKVDSVLSAANADTATSSAKDEPLTLPDGTVVKVDPVQYLPGGSKLNLQTGLLTLPNGTLIDTRTGARKVVDLTV
jgi:hypothetical protein